ncbi:nitrogen regulatory protein [Siccirubricoccus deserti]|uniref:PTS sugar transporter subunit IIA n=1 Tax=Siccirubricoccus deserti TaxID=2013562 RepID=A0A9X0QXV6_9PROT|nr:PTS sugar transporter subunit IIA [Siccirubricoccus deserti]MBC4015991.1 PTS sugar transporter subunit IIA [Siccirubricoccus deserti]GGC39765.1 nitrogen regulatory protein [Siccirubricoccus deserti]
MRITDLLAAEDVVLDLNAGNKRSLLKILAAQGASRLGRTEAEVHAALLAREQLGSTALGRGVALPHTRLDGDSRPALLFARLHRPIDFEARDDEPVDLVFTLLWPEASPEGFLPALAELCRALRNPQVLQRLRQARDAETVVTLLQQGTAPGTP